MSGCRNGRRAIPLALVMLVAGCGDRVASPAASSADTTDAETVPITSTEALRVAAERSLQEKRLYAPAGDNAIEHYLVLRTRDPQDAGAGPALTELQPYALIAAEQALAASEIVEARRLLALLARIDATAPALPRLRVSLQAVEKAVGQQQLAAAEAARALALAEAGEPAKSLTGSDAVVAASTPAPAAAPAASAPAIAPPVAPAAGAAVAAPAPTVVAAASRTEASPPVAGVPQGASASTTTDGALPRLLREWQPIYPANAKKHLIEGRVEVAFTIQPDGSVDNARVIASDPSGVFNRAALVAVSRYRFEASGRSHATTRSLAFRL